jgi:membrane-bound metal-dependent hydrolase YbcI (DUF457 family)
MPDLLAHYALSVLVAKTQVNTRWALLLGLLGLLPDIDALLRIHRWLTHSLVVIVLVVTPLLVLINLYWKSGLGLALLALLIVVLHPVMDVFTGLTPILWPLVDSVWIKVSVNGAASSTGVTITPRVAVITSRPSFTQREVVEGPLVTEIGVILAVVTAVVLVLDYFKTKKLSWF